MQVEGVEKESFDISADSKDYKRKASGLDRGGYYPDGEDGMVLDGIIKDVSVDHGMGRSLDLSSFADYNEGRESKEWQVSFRPPRCHACSGLIVKSL